MTYCTNIIETHEIYNIGIISNIELVYPLLNIDGYIFGRIYQFNIFIEYDFVQILKYMLFNKQNSLLTLLRTLFDLTMVTKYQILT